MPLLFIVLYLIASLSREFADILKTIFPPGAHGDADRFYMALPYLPIVKVVLALFFFSAIKKAGVLTKYTIMLLVPFLLCDMFKLYEGFVIGSVLIVVLPLVLNHQAKVDRFLKRDELIPVSKLKQFYLSIYFYGLSSFVILSLTLPIRLSFAQYLMHMFFLSLLYLLPYFLWFLLLGSLLDLGRIRGKIALIIAICLATIIVWSSFFLIIRSLALPFLNKYSLELSIRIFTAIFTILFMCLWPLTRKSHLEWNKNGRGLLEYFSFDLDVKSKVFWPIIFALGFVIKRSSKYFKNLNKDLFDEFATEIYYTFLPLLVILVSGTIVLYFANTLNEKNKKHYLFSGLLIGAFILPYFFFFSAPWTYIPENHWPYGVYVSAKGRDVAEFVGLRDDRKIKKYSNILKDKRIGDYPFVGNFFSQNLQEESVTQALVGKNHRPHVFIFVVDAASRHQLGAYGYDRDTSPSLTRFMEDSILFTHAFSPASDTYQDVNAIFSGQYVGRQANLNIEDKTRLCRVLGDLGYKIILSDVVRGLGLLDGNCPHETELSYSGASPQDWMLIEESLDTDASIPHFVYIHVPGGHPPWPDDLKGEFGRDRVSHYDETLKRADEQFGVFLERLNKRGIYENSIIVFTADHGLGLGLKMDMSSFSKLYSHSIDIPFVIKLPGIPSGKSTALYSHVDLLPSLAHYLGRGNSLAQLDRAQIHGRSFLPFIKNTDLEDRRCIFSIAAYNNMYASICANGNKIIWNTDLSHVSYFRWDKDWKEEKDLIVDIEMEAFLELTSPLRSFLGWGKESFGRFDVKTVMCGEGCER